MAQNNRVARFNVVGGMEPENSVSRHPYRLSSDVFRCLAVEGVDDYDRFIPGDAPLPGAASTFRNVNEKIQIRPSPHIQGTPYFLRIDYRSAKSSCSNRDVI